MDLNRAVALWQKGDLAGAAGACAELLATRPDNVNALQLLGTIHMQRGELDKARSVLERAYSLAPKDIHVLNTLGLVHRRAGRLDDALPLFRKAVQRDAAFASAYSNLGSTLFDLRRVDEARTAYRKLAQLTPQSPEAWAQLARLAELTHDPDDARRLAGKALELNPANLIANFVLARSDLAEGRVEAAAERVRPFADDPNVPPVNRAIAHGLIGQALEKLGRYDEAFAAFGRANAELKARFRGAFDAVIDPTKPEVVAALHRAFAQAPSMDWPTGEFEGPAPAFLVGFPRSGTTLLDQILASHSKIATIEERPVLLEMFGELATSEDCLARLAALGGDEINGLRAAYWQAMAPYAGDPPDAPVVVDKFPLNLVLLGVIARIFPDAKIIFALRDPRDVIMSCYQQRFGMNAAMYQFLELETAVAYYDRVMGLAEVYEERLPLAIHKVRYESVVADLRAEVEPLIRFLGLEWEAGLADYRKTARSRAIVTPSASQVVRPLYSSSIGKWRNYESQLAGHLGVLEQWVGWLGYGDG